MWLELHCKSKSLFTTKIRKDFNLCMLTGTYFRNDSGWKAPACPAENNYAVIYGLCLIGVYQSCVSASWLIRLTCLEPHLRLDKPGSASLPGLIRAVWVETVAMGLCTCFFFQVKLHHNFLTLLKLADWFVHRSFPLSSNLFFAFSWDEF